jgi:hypothetical protein
VNRVALATQAAPAAVDLFFSPPPARSIVQVAVLSLGGLVGIEAVTLVLVS